MDRYRLPERPGFVRIEPRRHRCRWISVLRRLEERPFFFDLLGFLSFVNGQGFDFTHGDFFADKNVFGIVLEVPNSALGSDPHVGLWASCAIRRNGMLTQIDRMGRPAINTVFNHGTDKNLFNSITPNVDRTTVTTEGI